VALSEEQMKQHTLENELAAGLSPPDRPHQLTGEELDALDREHAENLRRWNAPANDGSYPVPVQPKDVAPSPYGDAFNPRPGGDP
jgi:hypothetical protein